MPYRNARKLANAAMHGIFPEVITPGEIESFLNDVNHAALSLLDDMISKEDPTEQELGLLESYQDWVNGVWGPFYRENIGTVGSFTGALFAATLDRAEALRTEYESFRNRFTNFGNTPSRPEAPRPAETGGGTPPVLSTIKWIGISLAVLALIGLGIYFFRGSLKFPRLRSKEAT